jgi:hypothetical protein
MFVPYATDESWLTNELDSSTMMGNSGGFFNLLKKLHRWKTIAGGQHHGGCTVVGREVASIAHL